MTSWHHQIILISFQFNYGKTSGIWRFRLIASSPPIALGRTPPEVKKKKNSPPLLQIRPHWNLSACFFTRESIRLYVLLSHGTSNSIAKLWELRKQISEQSKPKRSIEEHDKYSIDLSCATPETWILLIKTHAHTTLCSFDLFQRPLCITVWLFIVLFKVSGWNLHEIIKTNVWQHFSKFV